MAAPKSAAADGVAEAEAAEAAEAEGAEAVQATMAPKRSLLVSMPVDEGPAEHVMKVLDPYQCLPRRNRKFASECTEVFLVNQGGESLSPDFAHFVSLEVLWLSNNRLPRIENLEGNIRVKEVYIENNRLVSLSALRAFKFLEVLFANGNQLRNLDKQLALLSKCAFLKKLDLQDNPAADEPDYRLRTIFKVSQVQILDQRSVKDVDRIRAGELVPNLEKGLFPQAQNTAKRKGDSYSLLERNCLRTAEKIRERKRREEDLHLTRSFVSNSCALPAGLPKRFLDEFRKDPTKARPANPAWPTPSEKKELYQVLEKRAGKPALTNDELVAMVKDLAGSGVDEVGRVLGASAVAALDAKDACNAPSLAKVFEDPEATVPIAEVVAWLLEQEWPRPDHKENDSRVDKLLRDAMSAEAGQAENKAGQAENKATCRSTALRLARGDSYLGEPSSDWSVASRSGGSRPAAPKLRGDVFRQSFLLSASGALQTKHTQLNAGRRSKSVP
jgi:hypothetical protein